ncbi:hypothetical protein LJB85_03835 [Porphyromonadaceae bacterium OttesenSCG-928-L07]|nr:hypothetical protein [Porphyromonadaceae bacterium OttesenSCG-928-L07]
MAKNNTMLIAAVIVAVVAVAAVGGYFILKGDDTSGEKVEFLIQDDEGVYFWVEGRGDSAMDAFKNAAKGYGIPYELNTDKDAIESMFYVDTSSGKRWLPAYWDVSDESWIVPEDNMAKTKASDFKYICILLSSGGTVEPTDVKVTPDDAVVLDKNLTGIKFLVQSPSGLFFKMSASGDNAYDALVSVTDKYNIPFVPTTSMGGGVTSMFDISGTSEVPYYWWAQFTSADQINWDFNNLGLTYSTPGVLGKEYIGIAYGSGEPPTVSPNGTRSYKVTWSDLGTGWETTPASTGVSITGVASVIDGGTYSFKVATSDAEVISPVLAVTYTIGDGVETTAVGVDGTYTIENVTGDLTISVRYTGTIKSVADISGILTPEAGKDPSKNGYQDKGFGYSVDVDMSYKNKMTWDGVFDGTKFKAGETYTLTIELVSTNLSFVNGTTTWVDLADSIYKDEGLTGIDLIVVDSNNAKLVYTFEI